MSEHPLCCDCSDCLNRGGGQKLRHDPIVHKTHGRPTTTLKARPRLIRIRGLGGAQADARILAEAYLRVMRRWVARKGKAA